MGRGRAAPRQGGGFAHSRGSPGAGDPALPPALRPRRLWPANGLSLFFTLWGRRRPPYKGPSPAGPRPSLTRGSLKYMSLRSSMVNQRFRKPSVCWGSESAGDRLVSRQGTPCTCVRSPFPRLRLPRAVLPPAPPTRWPPQGPSHVCALPSPPVPPPHRSSLGAAGWVPDPEPHPDRGITVCASLRQGGG